MNIINAIHSVFEKLEKAVFWLGLTAIFLMMLSITSDTIARYVFRHAIDGAFEFTQNYLMVGAVFLSMSYTYKVNGHIRLELFNKLLPQRIKGILFYPNTVLPMMFFALIAYEGWLKTWEAWVGNESLVGVVSWPTYLSYVWIPLGAGIMVLRLLLELIEQIVKDLSGNNNDVGIISEGGTTE